MYSQCNRRFPAPLAPSANYADSVATLIAQTEDVTKISTDDVRRALLLAWEQKNMGKRPNNQQANKLSAVKKTQGNQRFDQQVEENEGTRNNKRPRRGKRGGKQVAARQAKADAPEDDPSPQPSTSSSPGMTGFGLLAHSARVSLPKRSFPVTGAIHPGSSVYPSVTTARSLAERLAVRPSIETLKVLETGHFDEFDERPSKHRALERELTVEAKPPIGVSLSRSDDEVISLYDEDLTRQEMEDPADPSYYEIDYRYANTPRIEHFTDSPTATKVSKRPRWTIPLVAYVVETHVTELDQNKLPFPIYAQSFARKPKNHIEWMLDSGASLHFTNDINDFVHYKEVNP